MLDDTRTKQVMIALSIMLGGVIVIAIASIVLPLAGAGAGQVGIGLAILLSSFLVGALLGFLFSIPRVLARGGVVSSGASQGDAGASLDGGQQLLQTNSNLERVSDWLTTLLIGIALADLSKIGDGLHQFRLFVAGYTAPCAAAASTQPVVTSGCALLPALAPMLLLIGGVLGFLAMYLYTRIEIGRLFRMVEEQNELGRSEQRAISGQRIAVAKDASVAVAQQTVPPAQQAAIAQLVTPPTAGGATTDDALDTMMAMLYLPGGADRVLSLARDLKDSVVAQRADYWLYQAAAWGQVHKAALDAADDERAEQARKGAIDAARRAIEINPGYRVRLRLLTQAGGIDDDLATLANDPDLQAMLGSGIF